MDGELFYMNTATVQQTFLTVCLCEPEAAVSSTGFFPLCSHCENAVPLQALIQDDLKMCLYYRDDEEGDIKPLRPEMINGKD